MNLLLDTHVVMWWAEASPRLQASWIDAIVDRANVVYVSAASVWEVEIKRRNGKLPFPHRFIDVATEYSFEMLSIHAHDAALAGALDWEHRDPFDRMLAAQCIGRGLSLVTADDALRQAPGIRIL